MSLNYIDHSRFGLGKISMCSKNLKLLMSLCIAIFAISLPWSYAMQLDIILSPDYAIQEKDVKDCYHLTNPTLSGRKQDVKVSVNIMDIDQISEDNMEFRLHCYIAEVWENKNLNITATNKIRPTVLPPLLSDCMWKPDVIFPNTKEIITFQDSVPNVGYKYLLDGSLYRVERYMMRVSCPMMFNLYPFDTQHCVFKIALVVNPDELVKLQWYNHSSEKIGVFYQYKIEPLQFSIEDPKPHVITESWITGNYTELWANITFHRRMTGNIINFYIPSTLVVLLSWLSFYIDVQAAPARVTLGVTALLTITTQMVQARNILPPVQYITAIDIWLFVCLSVVFASFIEYSIAYSYQATLKKSTTIFTNDCSNEKKNSAWLRTKTEQQQSPNFVSSYNKLDKHSRWIFPTFMALFVICYWSYYMRITEIPIHG